MSLTPIASVCRCSRKLLLARRKLKPSRIAQVRQPRKLPVSSAFTGLSINLNSTSDNTSLTATGGLPPATPDSTISCGNTKLRLTATTAALTVPVRYSSRVNADLRPSLPLSCRLAIADITNSITSRGATALSMPTNNAPSSPNGSATAGAVAPSAAPRATPIRIWGTRPSDIKRMQRLSDNQYSQPRALPRHRDVYPMGARENVARLRQRPHWQRLGQQAV